MSIIIKGLGMPKEPDEMIEIAIFGDGKVIQTGESWRNLENGKCYYTPTTPEKSFNAVPVPPHGRLIDAERLLSERMKRTYYHLPNGDTAIPIIDVENAPTIIEAEDGE